VATDVEADVDMANNTELSRKDHSDPRATAMATAMEAAVDSNREATEAVAVVADSVIETETRAMAVPHSALPATRAFRKRLNHSSFDNKNN
jgi:predicted house-cleaning NTP pyrophosphatase (Maf/HAM1 superfamily)